MSVVEEAVVLVLGPGLAGIALTPEEFDAVEEFDRDYRYELIRGVLVVSPIPLAAETGPNDLLGYWLQYFQNQHPQGSLLDLTLPEQFVYLPTGNRRRPDRLVWAGFGREIDLVRDVPTIVIEFVSGSRRDWRRDYVEKRAEYREVGIPEYWIVDRFRRILSIYRADGTEQIVGEAETYRPAILPGFELAIGPLLARADRFGKPRA